MKRQLANCKWDSSESLRAALTLAAFAYPVPPENCILAQLNVCAILTFFPRSRNFCVRMQFLRALTKLCRFNQDKPRFLSTASIVFTSSLLVVLKRASLLMMRWYCRLGDRQSYSRCPTWPQLEVCVYVCVWKYVCSFSALTLLVGSFHP